MGDKWRMTANVESRSHFIVFMERCCGRICHVSSVVLY